MRISFLYILIILFFDGTLVLSALPEEPENTSDTKVLAHFKIPENAKAILLPVRFRAKEYLFELDTGSSHTVFDISLKDKLGKPSKIVKGKTLGGLMEFALFDAPEAFLGPLNLKDCRTVTVANLDQLSSALGEKINGIVGINFLKKYIVRIDFDTGMVTFLQSVNNGIFSSPWQQINENPDWGEKVAIKYKHSSPQPYINANVDGIKVDFLIDTGLKHYINSSPVDHLRSNLENHIFKKVSSKIQFRFSQNMQITPRGKAPLNFMKSSAIGRFFIGSLEYKDVVFDQSNESSLGLPFLSRHLITFDFPNNNMYLKKGKHFDKESTAEVSLKVAGFTLRRKNNNIFVSSIDPNGPAYKKDLRKNDIILKVCNRDVTSYGLVEFVEFLLQMQKEEDEVVRFTFKHSGRIKHASFEKDDMVSENYLSY